MIKWGYVSGIDGEKLGEFLGETFMAGVEYGSEHPEIFNSDDLFGKEFAEVMQAFLEFMSNPPNKDQL